MPIKKSSKSKNLTKDQILVHLNQLSFLVMSGKEYLSDQTEILRFKKEASRVVHLIGDIPKNIDSSLRTLRMLIQDLKFNYECSQKDVIELTRYMLKHKNDGDKPKE